MKIVGVIFMWLKKELFVFFHSLYDNLGGYYMLLILQPLYPKSCMELLILAKGYLFKPTSYKLYI